ncbi:hypothetical protein LTS18_012471, partial [Coniosporium uncinatum]
MASPQSMPTSSLPAVPVDPTVTTPSPSHEREIELGGQSSASTSDEDSRPTKLQRPKVGSRKSSRTLIIPRDSLYVEVAPEGDADENEMRSMSPRRSSEECQKLGQEARDALVEQAKALQASLLNIVEKVESVKEQQASLEQGNVFLQTYIGDLMQT